MINLPFNKWSLQFSLKEHEDLYDSFINHFRLKNFKIFTLLISILCLLFLMVFLLENQSLLLILMISAIVGSSFFLHLVSNKLAPYIKFLNFSILIWHLASSILIATGGYQIPLFMYGFSSSTLALPILQNSHYGMKMATIMIIPAAQLFFLDVYHLEHLEYILLAFFAQFFLALQSYNNEYMQRLAFSLNLIINQQKEIINTYVSDAIFAVSLNSRSQLFELEFFNNEFQRQYFISDQCGLKEFMRSQVQVQNKLHPSADLTNVLYSQEGSLKKNQHKTSHTLEEFAYCMIEQKNETEQFISGLYQNSNIQEKINIQLKRMILNKEMIIVQIKQEKASKQLEQNKQQVKYYINLISVITQQISDSHLKLYNYLMKVCNKEKYKDILLPISYINLSVMNKIKNYLVLMNSQKIKSQQIMMRFQNFHQYLINLDLYLTLFAKQSNMKLRLFNFTNSNLSILTQTKYLTQVIINLFELSIENSIQTKTITLEIKQIPNNNKENEQIIQFEFQFLSNVQIDWITDTQFILNPQILEDFVNNNSKQYDIRLPIINLLLSVLGPYNHFETSQKLYTDIDDSELYSNSITFYIYSDLSQMNCSYVNCIKHAPI